MGKAPDLVARPRAIRTARAVPDVEEVLVRQRDQAFVEDGQASGAGVEDADGPRIHARILGAVPGSVRRVLELHSANGAFAAIEDYLRAAGFFGGGAEDVVADLYLGYGLSSALRRGRHPDPPEPCPLPLAACGVRPELEPGLTGLIPNSEINAPAGTDPAELHRAGEKLLVRIMSIDPQRKRISLSHEAAKAAAEREEYTKFMDERNDEASSESAMALAFRKALESKKK